MDNLELLLEQANGGDAMAQYKLGRAYESGDGVEMNLATAKMWYQKSADNGYKNAEVKLRILSKQPEAATAQAEAPKTIYQAPSAPRFASPEKSQNNIHINQQTPKAAQSQSVTGQKSKLAAALLALFLGVFGGHDFYLGYKKQGIIKIVLTVTIIASIVSYVWSLIDLIKILCNGKLDSNGQLLK